MSLLVLRNMSSRGPTRALAALSILSICILSTSQLGLCATDPVPGPSGAPAPAPATSFAQIAGSPLGGTLDGDNIASAVLAAAAPGPASGFSTEPTASLAEDSFRQSQKYALPAPPNGTDLQPTNSSETASVEAISGFVSVLGTDFILNGQKHYFSGSNDYFLILRYPFEWCSCAALQALPDICPALA